MSPKKKGGDKKEQAPAAAAPAAAAAASPSNGKGAATATATAAPAAASTATPAAAADPKKQAEEDDGDDEDDAKDGAAAAAGGAAPAAGGGASAAKKNKKKKKKKGGAGGGGGASATIVAKYGAVPKVLSDALRIQKGVEQGFTHMKDQQPLLATKSWFDALRVEWAGFSPAPMLQSLMLDLILKLVKEPEAARNVHALLARINWIQGSVAQCASHLGLALERTADRDPYKAELLINRAIAFLHMSKAREALECAIRAIEIVEKQPDTAAAAAPTASATGKPSAPAAATTAATTAVAINKEIDWDVAHHYYVRACAYRLAGDTMRAGRDIDRALRLIGRNYAHRYAPDALYEAAAIQLSRKVGDTSGGQSARYYYEKAKLAEHIRDDGGLVRGTGVASDAKAVLMTKFGKHDAPDAAAVKAYKAALEKELSALMVNATAATRIYEEKRSDVAECLKRVTAAITAVETKRKALDDAADKPKEKKTASAGGSSGKKKSGGAGAAAGGETGEAATLNAVAEDNMFLSRVYAIRAWCCHAAKPVEWEASAQSAERALSLRPYHADNYFLLANATYGWSRSLTSATSPAAAATPSAADAKTAAAAAPADAKADASKTDAKTPAAATTTATTAAAPAAPAASDSAVLMQSSALLVASKQILDAGLYHASKHTDLLALKQKLQS